MPRKSSSVPAYCLHRHSGKAIVRIAVRDHYLGPHGSPESRAEYDRLIAEWLACGRQSTTSALAAESKSLLVNEVLLAYVEFAEKHYSDGQQVSTEFANLKHAIKPVKQLYGHTAAEHFGPLALKAIRQHMIEVQKLSRKEINKRIGPFGSVDTRGRALFFARTAEAAIDHAVLLSNHVPCESGIALVVAVYSAIKKQSALAGLVILGDLSIQGNIKAVRSLAEPLQVAMDNGARRALVPLENKRNFLEVSGDIVERVDPVFFSDPMTAAMKALGMT